MKIKYIVCFIFAVLGLLALVAYFFPKEGIKAGNIEFTFPSLTDVLQVQSEEAADEDIANEDTLSTEELMQMRIAALNPEKENEFQNYLKNNPARIHMPEGDINYLDPVFDALEAAREHPMRIMHYGDSQLEGDRISSILREAFQERFGGSGVGMVPALQTVPTYTLSQTVSPSSLPRYIVYGPKDMRLHGDGYGVMGQTATISGTTTFNFTTRCRDTYPYASRFNRIVLLTSNQVDASIITETDTLNLHETQLGDRLFMYTRNLGASRTTTRLTVCGEADVYGITLDNTSGVSLDNIPMRGCSGTIFTSISRSTLAPYYDKANARFIILQYGGNSVPYLKTGKSIGRYMKELRRQVDYLKAQAPQARFLFIGPSDMATSVNGVMQTYPMLPQVVDSLKNMADSCGIAYWDLFAAMGGRGSMVKWVDSHLAGPDYVHFTPKGARQVGNILFETLELYHKFYRLRTGKDVPQPETDSLSVETDTLCAAEYTINQSL